MPRHLAKTPLSLLAAIFCALAGCNVGGPGLLTNTGPQDAPTADAPAPATVQTTADCKTPRDADELTDRILRLINIERFELGAVTLDPRLSGIAARYSCTMIQEDFFGHVQPKTSQDVARRLEQAEYAYNVVGENLAAGYWNANEITDAWMASDTHREIMLDPAFTHAGIAVRYGGGYGVYCVLILAEPAG